MKKFGLSSLIITALFTFATPALADGVPKIEKSDHQKLVENTHLDLRTVDNKGVVHLKSMKQVYNPQFKLKTDLPLMEMRDNSRSKTIKNPDDTKKGVYIFIGIDGKPVNVIREEDLRVNKFRNRLVGNGVVSEEEVEGEPYCTCDVVGDKLVNCTPKGCTMSYTPDLNEMLKSSRFKGINSLMFFKNNK